MPRPTYYLETYGCTLNSSDSELIAGLVHDAGITKVNTPEEASFIILNTCGVKTPTEQKILHQIRRYSRLEGKILVITGCLPLIFKNQLDTITKIAPNFGAMIGPRNYHEFIDIINKILAGKRNIIKINGSSLDDKGCLEPKRQHEHVAILAIAEGCTGACTYCCTRFARGTIESYPASQLERKFASYIDAGAREVFLTAEDCSAYKDPSGGGTLPRLIERLLGSSGMYFIRVGMMNPRTLLPVHEDLARMMMDPRVFKFIHVPVQSGSDHVLEAMNRKYKLADFIRIMNFFKKSFPGITIATDIICGFPGETNEDFQQTIELIQRIKLDILNISMYGHRPGTIASKMKQVPTSTVKARTRELTALHKDITAVNNDVWIGWEGDVIIEEYNIEKRNWLARNAFYKPIIVDRGTPGEIVRVKITRTVAHYFYGEITG